MAINFTTTEKEAHSNGVKCLVYSGAGLGKTVLVATAPKPLLLSAESGLLSLGRGNLERLFGVNNPLISYNIPVITIETMAQLNEAYDWILQNINSGHFQTIGLDSVTEMAEVLLANLKVKNKDPRKAYGDLIEEYVAFLRKLRNLPVNVYMSAKMVKVRDEMSGAVSLNVMMPGQGLSSQVPYLFDEVFYYSIVPDAQNNQHRVLHTQPTFQYYAKDRSGMLDAMEAPNLTTIFNKIRGI